jgi:hypothetical protein
MLLGKILPVAGIVDLKAWKVKEIPSSGRYSAFLSVIAFN